MHLIPRVTRHIKSLIIAITACSCQITTRNIFGKVQLMAKTEFRREQRLAYIREGHLLTSYTYIDAYGVNYTYPFLSSIILSERTFTDLSVEMLRILRDRELAF